jgi:hypothetical protein
MINLVNGDGLTLPAVVLEEAGNSGERRGKEKKSVQRLE